MNKRSRKIKNTFFGLVCSAFLLQGLSCQEVVFVNLLTGLRDGLVGAAGGIITEAFNFGFDLEDEGHDDEHGDDLHVHP